MDLQTAWIAAGLDGCVGFEHQAAAPGRPLRQSLVVDSPRRESAPGRLSDLDAITGPLREDLRPEGIAEERVVGLLAVALWRLDRATTLTTRPGKAARRAEAAVHRGVRTLALLRKLRERAGGRIASQVQAPSEEDGGRTRWGERLTWDLAVSDRSPIVRGTWITVAQVVTRIVDGWSWADVLRAHPELTEDDIRACLAFTVEEGEDATTPPENPALAGEG